MQNMKKKILLFEYKITFDLINPTQLFLRSKRVAGVQFTSSLFKIAMKNLAQS